MEYNKKDIDHDN